MERRGPFLRRLKAAVSRPYVYEHFDQSDYDFVECEGAAHYLPF